MGWSIGLIRRRLKVRVLLGLQKCEQSNVNFVSSELKIDKQSELTIDHSQIKNNLIAQMVRAPVF